MASDANQSPHHLGIAALETLRRKLKEVNNTSITDLSCEYLGVKEENGVGGIERVCGGEARRE